MRFKIRYGAFETNSSSEHSIVVDASMKNKPRITKEEALADLGRMCKGELIHDDELDLSGVVEKELRFGWGYDAFTDFGHKLFYVLAECRLDDSLFDDIEAFLKEFFGVSGIKYARDDYGAGKKYMVGDVDHQSMGTLGKVCFAEGVSAIDFILDKRYVLIIDNDNG
jgi:hypothetical protein